jgi:hypothetical protein
MTDAGRPFLSILAAAGAFSLEHVSAFFSILAAIVAIIAGLPAALRVIRSGVRFILEFFDPPAPPAPQAFAAA